MKLSKFCESKYIEYRYFIKKCHRNIHKIKEYVPIYSTKLLAKVETAGSSPVYRSFTKVLELRSYLGFRTFLFFGLSCYTIFVKVFEMIINAYLSKKLLIILKRMIIIYLTRQLERIAETYPIRAKFV